MVLVSSRSTAQTLDGKFEHHALKEKREKRFSRYGNS